jgi:hypothetical protein
MKNTSIFRFFDVFIENEETEKGKNKHKNKMNYLLYGLVGAIGLFQVSLFAFSVIPHPLEKRAAYISGITSISDLKPRVIKDLQYVFHKHPLLVFKDVKEPNPNEFV